MRLEKIGKIELTYIDIGVELPFKEEGGTSTGRSPGRSRWETFEGR